MDSPMVRSIQLALVNDTTTILRIFVIYRYTPPPTSLPLLLDHSTVMLQRWLPCRAAAELVVI
jgi:hypothetical protein